MSSEASRTPSGSGSSTTGPVPSTVPEPAPAAADNPIARRAREVREAMARRSNTAPARGGQRGFMEVYANLARDPTEATLRNTASDFKAMGRGYGNFVALGDHIERELARGVSVHRLVAQAKELLKLYLSFADKRQLAAQGIIVGGRKKTRKGKSQRRRSTRRR